MSRQADAISQVGRALNSEKYTLHVAPATHLRIPPRALDVTLGDADVSPELGDGGLIPAAAVGG